MNGNAMAFFKVMLFLLLIGCSTSNGEKQKFIRLNMVSDPVSLDPRRARDLNSMALMRMLFDGLTRVSINGKVELSVAKEVTISPCHKIYSFKLRDCYWTNGDKVSSYDFAYSWRKMLSPNFPAVRAYQLYIIKNGKAVKENRMSVDALGVHTPDEETLIVELEYPVSYFLAQLSLPEFFAVNRGVDENVPNWAEDVSKYVSNGPFKLVSWEHNDVLDVEKNEKYWDEKVVKLRAISMVMVSAETELNMFETKELDWAGSPFSTLPLDALKNFKQKVYTKPYVGTCFLRINNEKMKELFQKPLFFKEALSVAIDRKGIVDSILQGGQKEATSLVPLDMGLRKKPLFKDNNGEKAKELFVKAIPKATFLTLTYGANERNHLIAQMLQSKVKSYFGIDLVLEAVEGKVFYERLSSGKYQMALGSWICDINDPIDFLEVFKYKTNSSNNTFWENSNYAAFLDKANFAIDQSERKRLLQKAERILAQEMPIIPLYHMTLNYLQSDKVKGVYISPLGHIDFKWTYVEE